MITNNIYNDFRSSLKEITRYYSLLVAETKNKRVVGSTNEWVLDNYYMISEQEKVMGEALRRSSWKEVSSDRILVIEELLYNFLEKTYYRIDKVTMFRYLSACQQRSKDYFSYPEVCLILTLLKFLILRRLATLCGTLKCSGEAPCNPEAMDQAAKDNLLMMNLFNSFKKITKIEMSELFDRISFSEKSLRGEAAGMYDQMCDQTKADYRAQIVRLCKKRRMGEYELVQQMVAQANERGEHVGWQLFPKKRWKARSVAYISIVGIVSLSASLVLAWLATGSDIQANIVSWIVCSVLLVIPLSQLAIDLFNQILFRIHKPVNTFKLKFKDGLIPEEYATMVIMPTILKTPEKARQMLNQLELYFLSNGAVDNLYFTLVGDASAEQTQETSWDDDVAEAGRTRVRELNEKYGRTVFNFVYRNRFYSEGERCWLGDERKRGAILHFNDLLLGRLDEDQKRSYFRCQTLDDYPVGKPITFVITLDTDTELVLYSAQKLIGAMAHPLNRAILSADGRRVDSGYGIMQPRVNVDVEVTNKSRYAQLFAGLGGLDVYTTASFELYQDIFNEGSFCGKGIYDLKVFQQVLKGAFPRNLILSHDLLEGCHIRCGLINDVELFDDNPSNYLDDAKRHHRWTRGDWQIIGWLRPTVRNEKGERVKNQVNTIGRWKIFDNLRRSVLSLSLLLTLFFGFTLSHINPLWYILLVMVVVATPLIFFIVGQVTRLPRFNRRYKYYMTLMRGLVEVVYKSLIRFALLPKEAYMYTDAIVRSCYRMRWSHRNLLNWVPSDEAAKSTKGTLGDYFQKFWPNYVASALLILCLACFVTASEMNVISWIVLAFTLAAWITAPILMFHLGLKFPQEAKHLSKKEIGEVEAWAKDTWHFFDSLITEENNYLVPDNYQLNRGEKCDYKTSPTNIGYSITSVISASELGFISRNVAVNRLSHIIDTVCQLQKWHGHLYNWYDIHSLKALPNFFISTADSGNFVACLYVLKGFLESDDSEKSKSLLGTVIRLIDHTDFTKLYNPELEVFSIGFDTCGGHLLPYHYNNFASEARLTSYLTIAKGDAPFKHWFCLDKTLVQYRRYKGVASWYGTMFEYFMPLIFLRTFKHTLMDETYNFAILAQKAFAEQVSAKETLPWGISETAYHELDDSMNYKYHAFGVPYLKFQNTTPDRIVISPYSSLLAISIDDRSVFDNMKVFKKLDMYDEYGFYESYDEEDHECVRAHYAHHQGMILASLTNYLKGHCLQSYFECDPQMLSQQTLLKEKAQVKPYIDLKVTKYKRYQYDKTPSECDVREYSDIAKVPEIGILSNGAYTVLMNDRGAGFSRYKNVQINRYRKVSSDHYGQFLYIRNRKTDRLWCNTYAPLATTPENYRVVFASDRIKFSRTDDGIETLTEIAVVKDRNAEIRRFTFTNNSDVEVNLELTTFGEVILSPRQGDESHRVFNAMTIHSDFDREHESLIFSKPAREHVDSTYYMIHHFFVDEPTNDLLEYETSRLKFIGRGGNNRHPHVLETHQNLSGTIGTTLDPIMSMRRIVNIKAGEKATAFLVVGFGKSREQVIRIVEQYRDAFSINNAFEMATVFSNMRTSLSLLKGSQMYLYNTIAKYLIQTAMLGNARKQTLARNTLSQSGLWRFGISGDLAILLLEIDDFDHASFAKEVLQAFEYYKVRGMQLDIVVINDEKDQRRENLTRYILDMANLEHLGFVQNPIGHVYVVNGSDLSEAERILFRTVARICLTASDGRSLEQQIAAMEAENLFYQDKDQYPQLTPIGDRRVMSSLEFYNQYGGFDQEGRDYVVTNTNTPMPWVNVLSNGHFGSVVSSTMSGFTFAKNAQQFKLTAWSNDIVSDPASEMLLIDQRQFVPSTARHGQGFSNFEAEYADFSVKIRVFVASEAMEKYYQISITNKQDTPQRHSLAMLYKLVMGDTEESTARYIHSEWDPDHNTLYARNVYHETYRHLQLGLTATETIDQASTDYPNRKSIAIEVELAPHSTHELAFVIHVDDLNEGAPSAKHYTIDYINNEYQKVRDFWKEKLSVIQVHTPDKGFNFMVNSWYLYQVCSARLYARAGFYQVGGATGFRDQLQDVMGLLYCDPGYARRQILDHAAHQFPQGDVLHWWHESLLLGARTTFSDDYLWLVFVTYQYVNVTGDRTILDERIPFCQAEELGPNEAERGMRYQRGTLTDDSPTLYEHLALCLRRAFSRMGSHHLPLMGCGDWNDGMSRVGVGGKGESVWVAFFILDLVPKMVEIIRMRPQPDEEFAVFLENEATQLRQALQENAWDGDWFLRAYFDNGDPMGSRNNSECQIDLITQAWSILTDVADDEQKKSIFRASETRLVNSEHEIIQLLAPPFKHSKNHPGYIMDYPKGVRENGGQYTHGAMWYIMALLKEGRHDQAYFYYSIINPIHRTTTLADVLKYKVEPYCIAADIYSNRQHPGRGGWTWYTGSASWAYKTAIENILGLRKRGDNITLAPHIPSSWNEFSIDYRFGKSVYHIHVTRNSGSNDSNNTFALVDDGSEHTIKINI